MGDRPEQHGGVADPELLGHLPDGDGQRGRAQQRVGEAPGGVVRELGAAGFRKICRGPAVSCSIQ
ncbi:hypothetical protein Smic_34840 [Streptomyces microflavus]|uniref:Uncharacterized protein n=1 Tax=Streptomyces microflavus TaxID=1919 RepID=A0A7J0CRF8_STRMI|nr:hypothetical protein Smic_34840 [Streptomyces microflavus]